MVVAQDRTPIYVVTKGLKGKAKLREFLDLPCPDKLITKRSSLIGYYDEILELGVGKEFKDRYKKKYKLKKITK